MDFLFELLDERLFDRCGHVRPSVDEVERRRAVGPDVSRAAVWTDALCLSGIAVKGPMSTG
jgi:hypothetical protein